MKVDLAVGLGFDRPVLSTSFGGDPGVLVLLGCGTLSLSIGGTRVRRGR